ncbi:MAG: translation elongation factor Ts [Eubacterium sp.]|jgi:elongation factor Ts
MAAITAQLIKKLRDLTGAGMMDCKKALVSTDGDFDKAIDVLRERGLSKAEKKADRIAAEGLVRIAFSDDHKQAAIAEVNIETDFAAKNAEFIEFVEGVSQKALDNDFADLESFMALPFGADGTVQETLVAKIAKIGEKISVRRVQKLATPGVVYTGYIHGGGRIGVIVGIKTDASFDEVATVGKDFAMQVASMNPHFVNDDEADPNWIAHEKEIARQQLLNEGKKPELIEKIIPGKIKAVLKEACLVEQKFVKNSDITVGEYVADAAKALGKDMKVVEMVRYEVGEGIEKKQENFAEEVAAQLK